MVDASTNSLTNTEEPHFQTELGLNKAHTQLLANEGKKIHFARWCLIADLG